MAILPAPDSGRGLCRGLGEMGEGRQSPSELEFVAGGGRGGPAGRGGRCARRRAGGGDRCPRGQLPDRRLQWAVADPTGPLGREGALRLQGTETAERVPLVGTPHGRALAAQAVEVIVEDGGARLFAPVTSRGEAVGVLELGLEDFPVEQTVADVALAAHFLAYVVIANRRYTDLFEWGQRSVPLSLAAEIQHRLLPGAFTCEAGQFTLAAWLQPAGEIGGDTFDFSLERDTLHVSMTDAMGHTMDAALLATVLVGGSTQRPPARVELAEQARLANDALAEQAGESQFVTGLLVRIDLAECDGGHRQRRPSSAAPAAGRAGRGRFVWRLTARSDCRPDAATGCKRCHWRWATG